MENTNIFASENLIYQKYPSKLGSLQRTGSINILDYLLSTLNKNIYVSIHQTFKLSVSCLGTILLSKREVQTSDRVAEGWRRDFTAVPFHLDLLIRSSRILASIQEKGQRDGRKVLCSMAEN